MEAGAAAGGKGDALSALMVALDGVAPPAAPDVVDCDCGAEDGTTPEGGVFGVSGVLR